MLVALQCLPWVLHCLLRPEKKISDLRFMKPSVGSRDSLSLWNCGQDFWCAFCRERVHRHHSILMRPPDPALNPWESQPQINFHLKQCPWHPEWLPFLTFSNFQFRDFWYFNIFKFNFASMWMNRLCWSMDLSWSPQNDYSSQRSRACGNTFKHLLILLLWFR